ncbi:MULTISPECIES: HrpJ domain-containing protein [unclassified Paludibacterium]|uniref:HrpJ domain-containing protein n=1 Tax=unclassified Paludibacterium TaxID=2618429 RepID=UPI001C03BC83|nr:HrpJ domain-containing protein [Paludibacterium sp. B53371]BEV73189.1 hypothetical protein THUN1379_26710 [Paludibacterium sp. THUN1379]
MLDSLRGTSGPSLPSPMPTVSLPAGVVAVASDSVWLQAGATLAEDQTDALSETFEDLGFALGSQRSGEAARRSGKEPGRVLAQKLILEIQAIEALTLESALQDMGNWQAALHSRQALAQFVQQDPVRMALLLSLVLARTRQDPAQRARLEALLASLLDGEEMSLSLFGLLILGPRTSAWRDGLRRLYHRASEQRPRLSQWLADLGPRPQRRPMLVSMIRVLSFELSASGKPIAGSHLAAVIGDLQRLLGILGLSGACDERAAALSGWDDGEPLLYALVQMLEQLWPDAALIEPLLPEGMPTQRYALCQCFYRLVQALPWHCFVDAEHKERLQGVLSVLRDQAAEM